MTDTPPFSVLVSPEAFRRRVFDLVINASQWQVLRVMLNQRELFEYAHSAGVCSDEVLRDQVPQLPPKSLRTVAGAPPEAMFLWTGIREAQTYWSLFQKHCPGVKRPRIVDFGMGAGRIVRFMLNVPNSTVHGAEINPDLCNWCRVSLPRLSVHQTWPTPPFSLDDDSVDLLYAKSVFSHLGVEESDLWLADIRRVLRPGGIAILTTMGDNVLSQIEATPDRQKAYGITAEEANATRERMASEGIVFLTYDSASLKFANAGDVYGNTFVSKDHVASHWQAQGFELLEQIPGDGLGYLAQDVNVLKKPVAAAAAA